MDSVVRRKLIVGAIEAVGMAADVARHVAWYVSYQIDGGAARPQPEAPKPTVPRPS
ncbi:MAG TPA: hypothetical protein VF752_04035 [Thermoleophilaceae bacterium]